MHLRVCSGSVGRCCLLPSLLQVGSWLPKCPMSIRVLECVELLGKMINSSSMSITCSIMSAQIHSYNWNNYSVKYFSSLHFASTSEFNLHQIRRFITKFTIFDRQNRYNAWTASQYQSALNSKWHVNFWHQNCTKVLASTLQKVIGGVIQSTGT